VILAQALPGSRAALDEPPLLAQGDDTVPHQLERIDAWPVAVAVAAQVHGEDPAAGVVQA
jgi:hypothetical protein